MSESLKSQSAKISESPELANQPEPAFGWTAYAEQINGRFAMLGFGVLLLLEFFTKQGLLIPNLFQEA